MFLAVAVPALIAGPAPGWAFPGPETNAAWPTEHQQELRTAANEKSPYAMRYSDEAAQSLGFREGRWEAFTPSNPLMPRVNGGLDGGRPMLHLQWRSGP
ncbi:MAG: hypothetical protein JF627_08785 [Alphaproteobacteria bacterium]|nr:hypothetical protein [Alphaproteobacteria bacterium]